VIPILLHEYNYQRGANAFSSNPISQRQTHQGILLIVSKEVYIIEPNPVQGSLFLSLFITKSFDEEKESMDQQSYQDGDGIRMT